MLSEWEFTKLKRQARWVDQVREHILGGDSMYKGPVVEESNMLLLNSQEACVVEAQRLKESRIDWGYRDGRGRTTPGGHGQIIDTYPRNKNPLWVK